jgi:predicted PurR-regulated permease PerM
MGMTTQPRPHMVPVWLHRAGAFAWRFLAIAAFTAVLISVAFLLGTVTASILVALMIAAIFAPMTRRLRASGWSRTKAAAAVTGAAFLVAIAALVVLVILVMPELRDLSAAIGGAIADLEEDLSSGSVQDGVRLLLHAAETAWEWLATEVAGLVGSVANAVTVAILALFLTFFVLSDGDRAEEWALQGTPQVHRERIRAADGEALRRVGGSLRGMAVVSVLLIAVYAAILAVLGVPHVAGLALLAVLGGVIPYLGAIIPIGAAVIVALVSIGTPATLVLLAALVAVTFVAERFVRPRVSGDAINLHPAVVLIVLPIGIAVAGVIGFIAAIPLTAVAVVVGRTIINALAPEQHEGPGSVPGWYDRLAQWSWRLLVVFGAAAVVIFAIGQAPLIVGPIVLAAIVAATVAPMARGLRERGWGATLSAAVATGGVFLLIIGLIGLAVAQLAAPIAEAISSAIDAAGNASEAGGPSLEWLQSLVAVIGGDLRDAVQSIVAALAVVAIVFVLASLLAFYFLRDAGRGWQRVLQLANPWRRDALDVAGRRSADILGSYMFGTAAISGVGAVSQLAIMMILGLPFVVPIFVLSFILAFIPYIGGFISTGLAFLIALEYGTPPQVVVMFIFTIVINIVQGNIVTPLVYNRAVNLHPAVVLLAVPAGGAIAGIAGMFLAVPILAVIAATWRTVLSTLGNEPPVEAVPEATPVSAISTAPAAAATD